MPLDSLFELGPNFLGQLESWLEQEGFVKRPVAQSKIAWPGYVTYTPVWTTTGTAPALGNGTLTGKYLRAGMLIIGQLFFGAGTTTTFGTGNYLFTLPVTSAAVNALDVLGSGYVYDSSANSIWTGITTQPSTTTAQLYITGAAGAYVLNNANPMAWATSDGVSLSFVYQAA